MPVILLDQFRGVLGDALRLLLRIFKLAGHLNFPRKHRETGVTLPKKGSLPAFLYI